MKKNLEGLKYEDKKIKIEKKTFKNWINMYLYTCDPPTSISSLRELGDGHSLVLLVERLLSKEFKRNVIIKHQLNPKLEIKKKENISIALEELRKYGMRISIEPAYLLPDQYDQSLSMILGFLWSLILKFQLRASGGRSKDSEKEMVEWINKSNEIHGDSCPRLDVKKGLRAEDFKDGRVLAYLVNSKVPDTISEDTIMNDPNLLDTALNAAKNTLGVPLIISASAIKDGLCGSRDLLTYFGVFREKSSKIILTDNLLDLVSDTSEDVSSVSREQTELNEKLREELERKRLEEEERQREFQRMMKAMQDQLEKQRRELEEANRKRLDVEEELANTNNKLLDKAGEVKQLSRELANEKNRKTVVLEPVNDPKPTYKLTMAPLPKLKYRAIHNKTPPVAQLSPISTLHSDDDELMKFYRDKLKKYGPCRLHNYVEPTDWDNGHHLTQIIHIIDPNLVNVDNLGSHSSRSLIVNALEHSKRILGKKYPAKLEANDLVTGKVDPSVLRKYLVEMRKKMQDAELIRWMNEHEKVNLPNKFKLNKLDYTTGEVLAHTVSRISDFDTKNMPKNAQELLSDVLRTVRDQCKINHNCDPTKVKRGEENKGNLRKMLQEMKRLHEISELQKWVNKKLEPYDRKVDDVLNANEYKDGNKYANLVNAIDPRVIEKDVSTFDSDTKIRKALNACKRDFKLLKELDPEDVGLAMVDRNDQFEFLTELKNYDDQFGNKDNEPVDLKQALNPFENVLELIRPPPRIILSEDPPRTNIKYGGGPNTGRGDESMIEVVTILQTEKDNNANVMVQPTIRYPPKTKDQLIWEMQLRELYYRKGRRTNFKSLTEEHEDNKFLEQRYRNFKQDLNDIYNELNELLLSDKPGKPDQKLVKEYQNKLLKYKAQLKEAKAVWVKAENKLGSVYEPKTETEVYFEKMRLKLLRVIDYPEKYTENPQRMHVLQGKIAQLNKELYRDNELFETVKILRRNRRVARHNLEDLLEKKQKRLRIFFFKGENSRLYNLIDDLESGINASERRSKKADIIKFMIDNYNSIFKKIPVVYKEISQLVTEPCKQIETKFKSKKDLYSKVNYKPSKVTQITTYSNNGFKLQLENVNDPFLLAAVVKNYFNQLGNSILSPNFNEVEPKSSEAIKHCRTLVSELPPVRRSTAAFIFAHFYTLAQNGNNTKMTSTVLSNIFSPIFLP